MGAFRTGELGNLGGETPLNSEAKEVTSSVRCPKCGAATVIKTTYRVADSKQSMEQYLSCSCGWSDNHDG